MNDERLQILKMVQQGKVSAEEAVKLLDAVEQPQAQAGRKAGAKPANMRLVIRENGKTHTISFGLGLVKLLLKLPATVLFQGTGAGEQVDMNLLRQAIDQGTIGKVVDIEQGNDRFEIWLDA